MFDNSHIRTFEDARPDLLGLSYRILGSRADAEDAVQDTYLKWAKADRAGIENPAGWLITICTRRCLDLLRSAQRSRVDYVGAWLPEPIHTPVENDAETRIDLAESLTTAFLLMLERLTPKERAAYLLREIFDGSYQEIADILDIRESACRKLVSRAKTNIDQADVRHTTPLDRQDQLLTAFRTAVKSGDTAPLAALLSDDVALSTDGGGKVAAILNVIRQKPDVTAFVGTGLHKYWADHEWTIAGINGGRGILLRENGVVVAAVSFAYDAHGRVTNIYIVRNPEKLANLDTVSIH